MRDRYTAPLPLSRRRRPFCSWATAPPISRRLHRSIRIWRSIRPYVREEILAGKRFFLTHGHLYGVKSDLTRVVYAARERSADILLYGHTHVPETDYEDGLYILNPGSIHGGGTYGVADLSPAGVVLNIVRVRS